MALNDNELAPTSIQDAIRQFEYRYEGAVDQKQPDAWAEELGDKVTIDQPLVRFPIGLFSGSYTEFMGEIRTKELEDRYADLKTKEFQQGYEVPAMDLLMNQIRQRQWSRVPNQFLVSETKFINRLVAAELDAGTSRSNIWDTANFFSTTHYADTNNPDSDQWSNYQASTVDLTDLAVDGDISDEVSLMQLVPGIDGLPMGVDPDVIMVPTGKSEPLKLSLAKAFLAAGDSNPFLNRFRVVANPYISATTAYLIDSRIMGSAAAPPWAIVEYVPPGPLGQAMRLRWFDENSDYFKNTSRLKVSSHIHYNAALLFPQAIRRLTIA